MVKSRWHPMIISIVLIVGLYLTYAPALAQQNSPDIQNLVMNGGFEEGFQGEFGVGYGWGGFSNGSASAGWSGEDWDKAVPAGQYAQRIEIKNATDRDRYAGIYQTIAVVPGQQYKLTIRGLVRSEEGSITTSDYGYRLQFAVDHGGGTTWELLDAAAWQEIPWDEQPLYEPADGVYRLETFETTLTPKSDRITLFIRGWKKWLNNGAGIFNLDEISLVGPAPAAFQAQAAAISSRTTEPVAESVTIDAADQGADQGALLSVREPAASPSQETGSALPVSGYGPDDTINYILTAGVILLVVLVGSAVISTLRRRYPAE